MDDQSAEAEINRLRMGAAGLEDEVTALRRRLQDSPKRVRTLEERLMETKGQLAQAVSQNEKLSYTLREAREHIDGVVVVDSENGSIPRWRLGELVDFVTQCCDVLASLSQRVGEFLVL